MKQSVDEQTVKQTQYTISKPYSAELVVKKSRFIAYLNPVVTKDEALAILQALKKKHWDAVHHCFAYRLGALGLEYRMSDDGEPSGTAGKPLLFALQKAALTNTILVVVRYFGGVKLGVGPLARAYLDTAAHVIEISERNEVVTMVRLLVHCMYDDVSRIIGVFEEADAKYEASYADAVTFTITVAESKAPFVTTEIIERTNARAGFSNLTRID